jgi:hypothetical protein
VSTANISDHDGEGGRFIFVPLTDEGAVASAVAASEVEVNRAIGVRALRITPEGDVVVETKASVRVALAGGIAWASVGGPREGTIALRVPAGRADKAVIRLQPPMGRQSGRRLNTDHAELVFDETVGVTNISRGAEGEVVISVDVLPTVLDGSGGFTRVIGPLFQDADF